MRVGTSNWMGGRGGGEWGWGGTITTVINITWQQWVLKMETKAVNVNITIKVVNGGELSEWANSTMSIRGNAQGGINNLSPSHDCWLPTSQRELRHVERKSQLFSARQNRQTKKKKDAICIHK